MKIIWGLLFCLALPVHAQTPPYSSLENPRQHKSWICDRADLLTDMQETILNQRLSDCERRSGAEVCLVTLKDCSPDPKTYATGLFNHWGVGKKERNNGILFLVVMDKKRMEIEAGLGLESQFSASWCTQMLTQEAVPQFRLGHPEQGIERALQRIVDQIQSSPISTPNLLIAVQPFQAQVALELDRLLEKNNMKAVIGKLPPAHWKWQSESTLWCFFEPGRGCQLRGPSSRRGAWEVQLQKVRSTNELVKALRGGRTVTRPARPLPVSNVPVVWDIRGGHPISSGRLTQGATLVVNFSAQQPPLDSLRAEVSAFPSTRWLELAPPQLFPQASPARANYENSLLQVGKDQENLATTLQLMALEQRRERAGLARNELDRRLSNPCLRALKASGVELWLVNSTLDAAAVFEKNRLASNAWVLAFDGDLKHVRSSPGEEVRRVAPALYDNLAGDTPEQRWKNLDEQLCRTLLQLRVGPAWVADGPPPARQEYVPTPPSFPTGKLMMAFFLIVWLLYLYNRFLRPRMCVQCRCKMSQLSESEDDQHLDPEQQLEERLGSVDYLVFVCPECSDLRTEVWNAWLTSYSRCPSCSRRTMTTRSQTIESPTYSSSGRGRTDQNCANCGYHDTRYYTIPRKTRSSSSSSSSSRSSGGSSFGGGRSGGGGGGASW